MREKLGDFLMRLEPGTRQEVIGIIIGIPIGFLAGVLTVLTLIKH